MSIRKTMFVKENSFRKLDDPFNDSTKKYVFYVKVGDVPEGIPMATNPRDQRLTSGVAQAIKESLESNDGYFPVRNQPMPGMRRPTPRPQRDLRGRRAEGRDEHRTHARIPGHVPCAGRRHQPDGERAAERPQHREAP